MITIALKAIAVVAVPIIVFLGGVWVISKMTDRQYTTERLSRAAPADRTPLNRRLGYDVGAVKRHWGALDETAQKIEQRVLELDLVFPFIYGAALAVGLLMAWVMLGRPFHPAWIIAPVAVTVLADWTENLVLIGQLRQYIADSEMPLQANWIQIASTATIVKLLFFLGSLAFLVGLAVVVVVRAFRPA